MKRLALILVFIISGCSVGYKKTPENITWTTWNEGNGQVIVRLPNADPTSFIAIDESYGKDRFRVYFEGKEIEGADPETFQTIRWYFSKDSRAAYYREKEIVGASVSHLHLSAVVVTQRP
ncbi:MAG: DKNYY domain-containing protein [Haliea sp.]|nr:DKNYY domain-containing protein [Haliea sp.]